MIIKIATMHGESHVTLMVEWVLKVSLKIPQAFCSGHRSWTGGLFVIKLAMVSELIKENERMRVMVAFQNYLPHLLIIFCVLPKNFFPPRLLSFTASNAFDFGFSSYPSENVLALYAFFNQWITQDSFRPSLDIIKWLTDIIGFTASSEYPSSPPLTPVHFCESQSLTQWDMWQSELIYNKFGMKGTFPCWFCYFLALKEK